MLKFLYCIKFSEVLCCPRICMLLYFARNHNGKMLISMCNIIPYFVFSGIKPQNIYFIDMLTSHSTHLQRKIRIQQCTQRKLDKRGYKQWWHHHRKSPKSHAFLQEGFSVAETCNAVPNIRDWNCSKSITCAHRIELHINK